MLGPYGWRCPGPLCPRLCLPPDLACPECGLNREQALVVRRAQELAEIDGGGLWAIASWIGWTGASGGYWSTLQLRPVSARVVSE